MSSYVHNRRIVGSSSPVSRVAVLPTDESSYDAVLEVYSIDLELDALAPASLDVTMADIALDFGNTMRLDDQGGGTATSP